MMSSATTANSCKNKPPTELSIAMSQCRAAFATVAAFSAIINVLMLASPIYMLQVYDRVLTTGRIETLVALTIITAVALLVMALLDSLRTSMTVRIGHWLNERLGPVYLASGIRAELKGTSVGAQPLRDLAQVQNFISTQGLTVFFDFPWVPLFVFLIWMLHPALGVIALAAAIVLLMLSVANEWATRAPTVAANLAQIRANQQAEATIRNAEVVRAMGMLPQMVRQWQGTNSSALASLQDSGERGGLLVSLTKFVRFFVQIAILGAGAVLVLRGELTAGGMIAASILLGRALAPVELAISAWRNFTSARIAYHRLKTQLETFPLEAPRTKLPPPNGRLSVEGLTYVVPETGAMVLRGVSFTVEPGEVVAVIGPSAAGKSTLCRFLVGLAQPTGGKVRLDGSLVSHWDPLQLGQYVGYLPQDVELFSGTVRQNIARMTDASDEAVIEAAMLAHAHEMVQRLPNGYDTPIGDRGIRLSGGQRQRLGLARAVFGDIRLLVLDEPNANLDQAGEAALAAALEQLKKRGAGILVVGHRPSTLAQADRVLLMNEGRVEMFGPRDEVLQKLRTAQNRGTSAPARTPVPADKTFHQVTGAP